MKRLIALFVVALLGFYVGWPAWSGYQIATALKAKDAATLERKIVFDDVRSSLRPLAVQKIMDTYQRSQANPFGSAIAGNIANDVAPAIADRALAALVTGPNLIRLVHDGRALKDAAEAILNEQIGKFGGLPGLSGLAGQRAGGAGGLQIPGGLAGLAEKIGIQGLGGGAKAAAPAAEPVAPAAGAGSDGGQQGFGLSNVKSFSFQGPLAFVVGVAKDAKATQPDVVTEMRFVGGDWRVVAVRPRI